MPLSSPALIALAWTLSPTGLTGAAGSAQDGPDYAAEIATIFEQRCVECHGPDREESGLRLDLFPRVLRGGDSGEPGVVAGAAARSEVLRRVTTEDEFEVMPPAGERLSDADAALLRRWIDAGAHGPEGEQATGDPTWTGAGDRRAHWAFQPLAGGGGVEGGGPSTLDEFIRAGLEEAGLAPSPAAEREVLIRRLYLDVHGLLPAPQDVAAFVGDSRPDAWPRLVDEVLASPRYGERWAQHWLDVVQYAETNGFEMNTPRPTAYHYRDWVIRALNEDLPYDRFVFQQLAGDTVGEDAATGFLVAGASDEVKSEEVAYTAQQRQDELAAMVNTTGTAFLGLTVGCARCHNHKFDPVSQREYYAMTAVLAGVRHGERPLTSPEMVRRRERGEGHRAELDSLRDGLNARRSAVTSRWNEERFEPRPATAVRFTVEATNRGEPCIDELEVWSGGENVALSARPSSSGNLSGHFRHALEHVNDGLVGNDHSWISDAPGGGWVQLDLAEGHVVDRVVWARDRSGRYDDRTPTRYRIELRDEAGAWTWVAGSQDRQEFGEEGGDDRALAASPDVLESLATAEEALRLAQAAPAAMVYGGRLEEPPPVHRLFRGDVTARRELVVPDIPAILGGLELTAEAPESSRRVAMARAITGEAGALAARVMVNRIWAHHFGTGLVATPGDLGVNGARPTHPALLDWLAARFIEDGWSMKAIHRRILLSDTYRQSSAPRPAALAVDAEARLLWRFPPRRLEAEVLRDCLLQLGGNLDLSMGGPGFSLFEPNDNYVRVYLPKVALDPGDHRRMVYMHKVRMETVPVFGAFDVPDAGQVCPSRSRSTTAIQALNLFNSPFVLAQARRMAARLEASGRDAVEAAYRLAYGRSAAPGEARAAGAFIDQEGLVAFCRAVLNSNELVFLP